MCMQRFCGDVKCVRINDEGSAWDANERETSIDDPLNSVKIHCCRA